MSHFHELPKHAVRDAAFRVFVGLAISCWAACGYPVPARRSRALREGHAPFAFDEYSMLDALGVGAGLVVLAIWLPRLIARHGTLRELERTQDAHFFARAGAPRSIHELLLGVAARDGHVGQDERDVVTRVLTRELPERVLPQDLKNWSSPTQQPRDPVLVARLLVSLLKLDERRTVLRWCREVAAADARVDQDESDLLRRLRAVLEQPRSA